MRISIVIPAHDEEGVLEEIVEAVIAGTSELDREVVVVDDVSSDRTGAIADELAVRYPEVRVLHRTKDNSFGNALRHGLANAEGEVVIPVMADMCDDVATISRMAKVAEETGVAFVVGSRYMPGGGTVDQPRLKGLFSHTYSRIYSLMSGHAITDITNAFKAYRRDAIEGLDLDSDWFDISVEIPSRILFERSGDFREVPTIWTGRAVGESKFKLFTMGKNYVRWLIFVLRHRFSGRSR
ncbi:MAG: glycosyltransferase family 2 protein [Candidatus Undinarchaeales archaeon]|nr:glycosyltransferase family 2 protein [Candidatus Undinarchaeales archaeon]MDP7491564.1 glycosyltransferase family 2 protein [Candidatus Undinarchaeales archaeon]